MPYFSPWGERAREEAASKPHGSSLVAFDSEVIGQRPLERLVFLELDLAREVLHGLVERVADTLVGCGSQRFQGGNGEVVAVHHPTLLL